MAKAAVPSVAKAAASTEQVVLQRIAHLADWLQTVAQPPSHAQAIVTKAIRFSKNLFQRHAAVYCDDVAVLPDRLAAAIVIIHCKQECIVGQWSSGGEPLKAYLKHFDITAKDLHACECVVLNHAFSSLAETPVPSVAKAAVPSVAKAAVSRVAKAAVSSGAQLPPRARRWDHDRVVKAAVNLLVTRP